jgi:hypothetical protein
MFKFAVLQPSAFALRLAPFRELTQSCGETTVGQLAQREKVFGSLAALFRIVKCCGCAPTLTDRDTRRLILDGLLLQRRLVRLRRLTPARAKFDFVETCVCLHALSSFQRTDRFAATFAAGSPATVRKGTF